MTHFVPHPKAIEILNTLRKRECCKECSELQACRERGIITEKPGMDFFCERQVFEALQAFFEGKKKQ